MKSGLISLVLFILFTGSAFSVLDSADINEIRLIIKEENEASEERMQKRMETYISQEISKVNTRISEMDKRLTTSISEMDKRLTTSISELDKRFNTSLSEMDKRLSNTFSIVVALMALIAVMVGLPQIIALLQRRSENKQFAEQQKQIDALKQQIETLQTGTER